MTHDSDIVAKEGLPFIILIALFTFILFVFVSIVIGCLGFLICCFCVYFFRNPRRITSLNPGLIYAPADGQVIAIAEVAEKDFFQKSFQRVTIFMSPLNVHVNRSPVSGIVKDVRYFKGEFLAAFRSDASEKNERSVVAVVTPEGHEIVFVQIAGWFARRIVTYPKTGDALQQGQIIGLIRFGSRMDVYFPAQFKPSVVVGQKVKAGFSVVASC